jgi:hypothetical protein
MLPNLVSLVLAIKKAATLAWTFLLHFLQNCTAEQ